MQIRYRFMGPQMTGFTKLHGTCPGEKMTQLRAKKRSSANLNAVSSFRATLHVSLTEQWRTEL